MAKDKKGFILYADQRGTFDKLPDEIAGKLIKLIFSYVNDENPIIDDLLLDVAFDPIKLQLKRDLVKYEEIRGKRSEAGKKSAELKAQQRLTNSTSVKSVKQSSTNSTDIVNVNDTVNDTVNEKEKIYRKFTHLKLSFEEYDKLLKNYSKIQIDTILDNIENYRQNTKYKSLYFTANKWLKKEHPEAEVNPNQKYHYTIENDYRESDMRIYEIMKKQAKEQGWKISEPKKLNN